MQRLMVSAWCWESGEPCAHGNSLILWALGTALAVYLAWLPVLHRCHPAVSSTAMQKGQDVAGFTEEGPTGVDRTCRAAWGPELCNFNPWLVALTCSTAKLHVDPGEKERALLPHNDTEPSYWLQRRLVPN